MDGELWRRGADDLLAELRSLEARMRRDHAAMLGLVAEVEARGVAVEAGYPGLPELLRDVLRISTVEARRRIGHARALTGTPLVSGGTTPALLPATAVVARTGDLGPEHVEVILAALDGLPPHVSEAERGSAERVLVDAAAILDARTLRRVAVRVREVLDQDGAPPSDADLASPVNELHLTTRRGGRLALRGEFDQEAAALLRTALDPLAGPRPADLTGPDRRTAAERNGDALVEVLRLSTATGHLPTSGGERPHVLVTVALADLRTELAAALPGPVPGRPPQSGARRSRRTADIGVALLDGGTWLSPSAARRLACDATVIPAVLGARSEPVDIGRASHTVSTAIRRALVLRDRGCAFPGCDRSHRWTDAHHVRHWADGGPTDLANLVLLCGRHHRLVHHTDWTCAITDGRPEFRPPGFVDPDRAPRRNLLHRHPDLVHQPP